MYDMTNSSDPVPLQCVQPQELWQQTNKTITGKSTKFGHRSEELSVLVQNSKNKLTAIKSEVQRVKDMKEAADTKITEVQAAITAARSEKENLQSQNGKSSDELAVLNRQLHLISSALADAQRRLQNEKGSFEKELESQRTRLHAFERIAATED